MFIDNRIHFNDLETGHATVIGDDLHRQMRFAIGGTAADGRANSWSVLGIDPVHVERDVVASSAASSHAQSLFHYRTHSALVDVAHGKELNAGTTDVFALLRIDVPNTNENAILGCYLRREAEQVNEFRWSQT